MNIFQKLNKIINQVVRKMSESWVAVSLLCIFFTQTVFAAVPMQEGAVLSQVSWQAKQRAFFERLQIPREKGQLDLWVIPERLDQDSNPVLFIQDAHANPDAQKNIAAILNLLAEKNQLAGVAVEGAFGPVDGRLLDIFDDEKINREFSDQLVAQGQLTGAEIFSRDARDFQVPVSGADDRTWYLNSYKAYQKVKEDKTSQVVIENYRKAEVRLEMAVLNPELARFFRERRNWLGKGSEAADYVRLAGRLTKSLLGIDLAVPERQFEWPALMRLVRSLELEDKMDAGRVKADILRLKNDWEGKPQAVLLENASAALLSAVQDRGFRAWLEQQDPPSIRTTRRFFEALMGASAEAGLSLLNYPDFLSFAAILILHEEISTSALMDELGPLEEKILEKLIQSPKEREVIRFSQDLDILEKLMELKLTREDYQVLIQRQKDFSAVALNERLQQLMNASGLADPPVDLLAQNTLEAALDFYHGSTERDSVLVQKTLELKEARRQNPDSLKVTVLIAGGFHQEGILRELDARGIAHAVLTPKIKTMPAEPLYEKVMLGENTLLIAEALSAPATALMAEILGGVDYLEAAAAPRRREGIILEGLFSWRANELLQRGQSPEAIYAELSRGLERASTNGLIGKASLILKDAVPESGQAAELQLTLENAVVFHYALNEGGARQTGLERLTEPPPVLPARLPWIPEDTAKEPELGSAPTDLEKRSEVRKHPVVITSDLTAEEEYAILNELYEKLKREQSNPGSQSFLKIVNISDEHGTIDKFDALILDSIRSVLPAGTIPNEFELNPDKSLADQLALFNVTLENLRDLLFVNNIGDLMDRGPFGVKVFRRSRELIRAGLSFFVAGNHDLWEALNLWGIHLPWYEGFNFYSYSDSYDQADPDLEVNHLLKKYHQLVPQTRTKSWWAQKLKEFTDFHQAQQKSRWNALDVRINGDWDAAKKKRLPGTGLYAQVSAGLTPEQDKLWGDLRGYSPVLKIDTYSGVRAAGLVSVVWWEALLRKFKVEFAKIEQAADFNPVLPSNKAWQEAIQMIEEQVLPELRSQLDEKLKNVTAENPNGQWWWRVFEAVNSQNYSSVEWWAKDWVYHKDWGTSVLEELNAEDGNHRWDAGNYLDNRELQEIAEFYRDNFNLYFTDIYQNTGMHAFLPVDPKTGEFYFTYRDQEYRGKGAPGKPSAWEGLSRISNDVKDRSNTPRELYDALSLVNSWYADATTEAKAPTMAKVINKFGLEHLAQINGLNRLLMGHVPFYEFHKLGQDKLGIISSSIMGGRFFIIDHGMGERFGSRGAYLAVHPDGVTLRGYEHDGSLEIVDNPRTVKTTQGTQGAVEEVLFENHGIPREVFFPELVKNVEARLQELKVQISAKSEVRAPKGLEELRDTLSETVGYVNARVGRWKSDLIDGTTKTEFFEKMQRISQILSDDEPGGLEDALIRLISDFRTFSHAPGDTEAEYLETLLSPARQWESALKRRSEVRITAQPFRATTLEMEAYLEARGRNTGDVFAVAVAAASRTVDLDLTERYPAEVRESLFGERADDAKDIQELLPTAEMRNKMETLLNEQTTVERPKTVVLVSINGKVPQIDPRLMDLLPGSRVVILDRRGSEAVGRRQFSKLKLRPDLQTEHVWFQGEYPTLEELQAIFEKPASARQTFKEEPGQSALPLLILPYVEERFLNQYAVLQTDDGLVVRTPKMRGVKLRESFSRFLGLRAVPAELRNILPDEFTVRVREKGFSSAFIPLGAEGRFASLVSAMMQVLTVESAA